MFRIIRSVGKSLLGRYLIVTNVATGCGLITGGDMFNQVIIERRFVGQKFLHGSSNLIIEQTSSEEQIKNVHTVRQFDNERIRRMLTLGVGVGLVNHCWYSFLDWKLVGKTGKIVFKKVILDQTIAGPIFALIYFTGYALLEGKNWNQSLKSFKEKFITVFLVDLCFWPPAQTINFLYIPNTFRVIYVSICGFLWCTFMSFMQHRGKPEKDIEELR